MEDNFFEIPRDPQAPKITDEMAELLTSVCFRKNATAPLNVDTLFIFGSVTYLSSLINKAAEIIDRENIKTLIITGGKGKRKIEDKNWSESGIIFENLHHFMKDDMRIYTEGTSTNTLENVTNILDFYDLTSHNRLCYIHKYQSSGRAYFTLRRFLPKAELVQAGFIANNCHPESWFKDEAGIRQVWGEFLRIYEYGKRGDIDISEDLEKINKIKDLSLKKS